MVNRVTWVVQTNLGSSATVAQLQAACELLGQPFVGVKLAPFAADLPDLSISGPVLVYGGPSFVRAVASQGVWRPGAFFQAERFRFSTWRPAWREWLLNDTARVLSLAALAAESGPADEVLFVRPDYDQKAFAGGLLTRAEIRAWCNQLASGYAVEPDTLVVVDRPRQVTDEWRCFVVDGRVVTASQYRVDGEVAYQPGAPASVIALAEQAAARFAPAPAFALDLARSEGRLGVEEANNVHSSGLYAADVTVLVDALSTLAHQPPTP
jgi:hypothetical protein